MANWYEGVVHGDLKPQNILIFCDENGGQRYVPKVADFGYSALIAKENAGMAIYMPGTPRWCSPEWYPGFATTDIMDAKRMDAYSFGLLCAWLLFNDTFPSTQQNFDGESHPNNTMLAVVGDLNSSSGISAIMKRQLYDLFDKTLVHDSLQRCSEFWQMMRLLSPKRYALYPNKIGI
jgi:serine/threonine protein kinase